jgi:hypothetical protein
VNLQNARCNNKNTYAFLFRVKRRIINDDDEEGSNFF